jgi:hypothetical protein
VERVIERAVSGDLAWMASFDIHLAEALPRTACRAIRPVFEEEEDCSPSGMKVIVSIPGTGAQVVSL